MKIEQVNLYTKTEWESYWKSCPEATFFHHPDWFDIWAKHLNGKLYSEALLFTFSDGKTALLPYAYTQKLGVKFHLMGPLDNYGGWISLYSLSKEHHFLLLKYITKIHPNLRWISELDEYWDNHLKNIQIHTTSVFPFSQNFDSTLKTFKRGVKWSYKKAQKESCRIIRASNVSDWLIFYDIYLKNISRWEKPLSIIKKDEFMSLAHSHSPYIHLYLVEYKNKIIAGGIFFFSPQKVHYWQGASLEKFHHLRAMHFLIIEVTRLAFTQNIHEMDMGPSYDNIGVLNFKKGFNTTEKDIFKYEQTSFLGKTIKLGSKLKRKLYE